jgi:hypothetical protein
MPRLPESPRIRRRLFWTAALLAAAGTAAGLITLIPNTTPGNPGPAGNEGPAQTVAQTANLRVTAADRKQIDALLDRFVPAAVERKSAVQAWSLAGPELKASSTLAQWRAGESTVPYYPARGTTFHGWRTLDIEPGRITFNLLVHARPSAKLGDYTFAGQVIRQHGRWLVNRLYTTAINNPARNGQHEVGPADFQAPGSGNAASDKPRLGRSWLLPIVGILSLAVLVPLGLGIAVFVRSRRRKHRLVSEGRTELPPLPSGFRSE